MPSVSSVAHKTVIGLFLALVVGVVYLQGFSDRAPTDAQLVDEAPMGDLQPVAIEPQFVCGDGTCNEGEDCGNCAADCGLCFQAFCCNVNANTCDGPFGITQEYNPCFTEGYSGPYVYRTADQAEHDFAFDLCSFECQDFPVEEGLDEGVEQFVDDGFPAPGEAEFIDEGMVVEEPVAQPTDELPPYYAFCGNGVIDEGEYCDNGEEQNTWAPNAACRPDCTPGRCTDGVVDVATEECDDLNIEPGDGCDANCHFEIF